MFLSALSKADLHSVDIANFGYQDVRNDLVSFLNIAANCKNLRVIQTKQIEISEDEILYLFKSCHQLLKVSLECETLTNTCLEALVVNCPSLVEVKCSRSNHITVEGVINLLNHGKCFQFLCLTECQGLRNYKSLDDTRFSLSLDRNDVIKSYELDEKLEAGNTTNTNIYHSHLLHLNLSGCKNITMSAVVEICRHCTDLRFLDLRNCFHEGSHDMLIFVREILGHCLFLQKHWEYFVFSAHSELYNDITETLYN